MSLIAPKQSNFDHIDDFLAAGESFHFSRQVLPNTPTTPPNQSDHYSLILLESGSATHRINDQSIELSAGDVVFVRPGDIGLISASSEVTARLIAIRFRTETADYLLNRYREDLDRRFFWTHQALPVCIHLNGAQRERAVNTCLTMETTLRTQLRLEHFLLTMMTFVLDDVARIDPAAPDWLIRACQAAQRPDVFRQGSAGFLNAAGRGHEHVCRVTRKYLGTTPTKFVNRIRIQHGAMLLRDGRMPLFEIAEACGIDNLSYFHRLFRDQYGCTPDTYRKRHQRDRLENG